eukprot:4224917-Pyramimonas_sp.AAC.1
MHLQSTFSPPSVHLMDSIPVRGHIPGACADCLRQLASSSAPCARLQEGVRRGSRGGQEGIYRSSLDA